VDHPRAGKDEEQDDYLFGNKKEFVSAKLLMNGQTTAENMQTFFERNLSKMGRDLMGLPVGKTLVMFLDYLNMPLPEQYGAQPPLEASSSSATTASMISTITAGSQ